MSLAIASVALRKRLRGAAGCANTLVRPNGQSWMISDIYLDGAVSEVATRRTECAFHIRDGRHWTAEYGIERKIELLRVAVVKSF